MEVLRSTPHLHTSEKAIKTEEKVKRWLKDPHHILLILLIVFITVTHLYFFSFTANQPTWWDEGDYLGLASIIANTPIETPEWFTHFASMRPLLMPLIWAFFIKIGTSEAVMRLLTVVFPSILLVIYSYLLGASLFNKRIGLITGYLVGMYWVILFYSHRFLTDIPAMLLAIMSLYYFWEYYIKNKKPIGLYLAIFLGVLGFLTRFPTALITFAVLTFLLLVQKQKFFTTKTTWIAGAIGVLTLIPWFLFNKFYLGGFFPAFSFYGSGGSLYTAPAWYLFSFIPRFIGITLTVLFLAGIGYALFKLIIGIDIFLKQKDKSLNKDVFLILWLFFQVFYFVFMIKTGNDRWILLWMPPIFMYAAYTIDLVARYLDKYQKYLGVIFIVAVLLFAGYNNFTHADSLTKSKLDTYKEVKDIGLWINENTPKDAKILAASNVQTVYYSNRRIFDFYLGTEQVIEKEGQIDSPQGPITTMINETIRNETEFECKILRIQPDYLALHLWEPIFTPQFIYDYPQRHPDLLQPLKLFDRNGQVMGAIYKFIDYPVINESLVNCTWVYERPEPVSGLTLDIKEPSRWLIPS